jgi:uncharacterized iron-regulated protein
MRVAGLLLCVSLVTGCAAEDGEDASSEGAMTQAEAPAYDGDGFRGAQILRVADGKWLDESAFAEAVGQAQITFFGEQHLTSPVQALERWVFAKVVAQHPDAGLAMEHFQRDEQPVIQRYFHGEIDQATFEAEAQPWTGYATYWRPLVEDARASGHPLFALNVPKEVLDGIYAQFPAQPLDVFNRIPATHPYAATLPARPLPAWDATYQRWFESSYDYAAHGAGWGLSYDAALRYFTDLAHVRDETMAHWVVEALSSTPHLLVVAGDWHVQTRLAVPDRVTRTSPSTTQLTLTTAPFDHLDEVRAITSSGRAVADYIISYR